MDQQTIESLLESYPETIVGNIIYLVEICGLKVEEAIPVAENYERPSQTEEEIYKGVIDERARRDQSTEEWLKSLKNKK